MNLSQFQVTAVTFTDVAIKIKTPVDSVLKTTTYDAGNAFPASYAAGNVSFAVPWYRKN